MSKISFTERLDYAYKYSYQEHLFSQDVYAYQSPSFSQPAVQKQSCLKSLVKKIKKFIHLKVAFLFVPAAKDTQAMREDLDKMREESVSKLQNDYILKRISLNPNSKVKADGMVICPKKNKDSDRILVFSTGNKGRYEWLLKNHQKYFKIFEAFKVKAALIYNFPKVGRSEGELSRETLLDTARTALEFAQDKENGLAAKKIIELNFSVSGGVLGQLYKTGFKPDPSTKYVCIQDRTFDRISNVVSEVKNSLYGFLTRLFDFELDALGGSLVREHPQIITYHNQDTTISPKRALATAVEKTKKRPNVTVLELKDEHEDYPLAQDETGTYYHSRPYRDDELAVLTKFVGEALDS